jgi:peptidyl-tRNA hydrolase
MALQISRGVPMKMYILVREDAPRGHAINSVGHASLACYLRFKDDPDMQEWLKTSFKKVTCKVSDKEFWRAAKTKDYVSIFENDLDHMLMALAFKPRKNYPKYFSKFRLYS